MRAVSKREINSLNKRIHNAFSNHLDDALLSQKLVTIPTDLDLPYGPDETKFEFYPSDDLIIFLKELGFKTSVKKIEEIKYAKDHENPNQNQEDSFRTSQEDTSSNYHLVTPDKFNDFFSEVEKAKNLVH